MKGVKNQPQSLFLVVEKSHGWVDTTGWAFQGTSSSGILGFSCGNGTTWALVNGPDVLDGNFHHVAGTWNGSLLALYVDGVQQGTAALSNPANNTRAVNIGYQWGGGTPMRFFRGQVDEPTVYSRGLSAVEVQAIYQAGTAGKAGMAPVITTHPAGTTTTCGNSVTLWVSAVGVEPLAYQWYRGAGLVANATNATLSFTASGSTAGAYTVVVTNSRGSVTSQVAAVAVMDTAPPTITCPGDITVNADVGQCLATSVVLGTPTASDNCGSVTVTSNAPAQFPVGTTMVRWTATDSSGNTNACTQLVVVNGLPVANLATYTRSANMALKILISDLRSRFTSDPENDERTLDAVRAGTNNATIWKDATYIYYEPSDTAPNRNTTDHFNYEISDGRSGLATNAVQVTVVTGGDPGSQGGNLQGIETVGTHKKVKFWGIHNYAYRVQRTEALSGQSTVWTDLPGTATQVSPGYFEYEDTSPPPGTACYRTVWP
jgi:hypothetical protein